MSVSKHVDDDDGVEPKEGLMRSRFSPLAGIRLVATQQSDDDGIWDRSCEKTEKGGRPQESSG